VRRQALRGSVAACAPDLRPDDDDDAAELDGHVGIGRFGLRGVPAGFGLTQDLVDQLAALPASTWQPAYDADGEPRPGAWVIEATGLMNLSAWPKGMRVIVRRERPHPGAQLRLTDPDGHRYVGIATNTAPGGPGRQLANLELRHRRRARVEDRIRAAKDTGLRNLPLHGMDQNRIWQAVVALACEITT
jgi:hypothetical protein